MSGPVAISDVIDVVCEHFKCSKIDLRSARRTAKVIAPRQIAMYLARKLTEKSLPQIGQALGGRDHTTVIHGANKVEAEIASDATLAETVFALESAALSLGQLRGRGMLPEPEEPISPLEIARNILRGGRRAALRLSPDAVIELAEALVCSEELLARGIAPAPIFVEAPGETLGAVIHDFIGAEAMLRSKPSLNLRAARDELVEKMRQRQGKSAEVDAVVAAFDAMCKAEFTAAERDATERYRRSVSALARAFLKTKEDAVNG
ncbi:MAG TPA: helix-turn-helix domain-containing protein [Methylocystis sp.]|jgi:hypothetical protein